MKTEALLFDCDGVIAETERDGHRVAFNEAFADTGLPFVWEAEMYGELARIAGGKERMIHYFTQIGRAELCAKESIAALHLKKSEIYQRLCAQGRLPARPGVREAIQAAKRAGLHLAVCSTSKEDSVRALMRSALGEADAGLFDLILAGDVVAAKKPAPDIYQMAADKLNVAPEHCLVVEDSAIGLRAAKAAGMRCVVTVSVYSRGENFEGADAVVENLASPRAQALLHEIVGGA